MAEADALSTTFFALADPTRLAILGELSTGEKSVSQLAKPFRMTMPAVTKHLHVLERAGLIERGRRAQWRPCRLKPAPLKEATEWLNQYREYWESSFDKLEQLLTAASTPLSEKSHEAQE
jgi:DNA-binding transcriptional ArsR family regulator